MKKFVKYSIIMLCAIIFANSISAQVGNKSHINKKITYLFINHDEVSRWVGPHSDTKEKSGLTGWTEVRPNDTIALEVSPDSVSRIYKGKKKTSAKLAFRLTADPLSGQGQNYLIAWSKVKTVIHIAKTQLLADGFAIDKAKERGVGFNANTVLDKNTAVCHLVNNSSVSVMFTDPRHPFYGKTLGPKKSLGMNSSQRKMLTSTGFKTSEMLIIKENGEEPISIVRTLPILENSDEVILTDNFFDLRIRDDSKFYPLKLKTFASIDVTITGAYNSKGEETTYVIPGGPKGQKGKIIYLQYGENQLNLNYNYKEELPQTIIIRADERGVKTLKFQTKGELRGKWILDI